MSVIIQGILEAGSAMEQANWNPRTLYSKWRSLGCFTVGPPVARGLICIQNITNNSCTLICMTYNWRNKVLAVNAAWWARNRAKRDQPSSHWLSPTRSQAIGWKKFITGTFINSISESLLSTLSLLLIYCLGFKQFSGVSLFFMIRTILNSVIGLSNHSEANIFAIFHSSVSIERYSSISD